MKKIMVILLATVTLGFANKADAQGYGSISFNTFYNELSPYGRWVDDLDYGQVWIADEQGFEPYYNNGHWVYTSYGWTWASDYAWGWAPFHYGRWTYLNTWGWAWVPGYEWGPAWVGWCQNDGYYGWAPLSPGMGFNFSYNSIPNNYWRFVRQQYITGPSIRNHIVRPDRNRDEFRNVTIINNTQINNNVTYVAGPNRESVERITRKKIDTRPVAFNRTDERTRIGRKEVRMYRPDLKEGNGAAASNSTQAPVQNNQPQRQQATSVPNKTTVQPVPGIAPANAVQPMVKQPVEQPVNRDNNRRIKPMPVTPKPDNETAIDEPAVTRLPNEREVRRQRVQNDNETKTIPPANQRQDELRQQRAQEQLMKEQQMKVQREQQQTSMQQERQQELRQQQLQQQEQLRRQQAQEQEQKIQQQRAMQQQNEQRQNEIRQQQLKEQQRKQQQSDLQQQNQQRQNEVRQQQLQEQRAQQRILQQQNRQQQNEIRQQRVQETPVRPQRALPMDQKPTSRKPNEN